MSARTLRALAVLVWLVPGTTAVVSALLSIWHRPPRTPAHRGNTRGGLIAAYRADADGIDVDGTLSREGVNLANHWQRLMIFDGYRDPGHEIPRTAKVRDLTWRQLSRLRTGDQRRVRSLRWMMRENLRLAKQFERADRPLIIYWEVKVDPRFRQVERYRRIKRYADRIGCPFVVMTQPRGRRGLAYARAAKAAGVPVVLLRRGPVSKEWMTLLGPDDRIKHGGKLWTPEQVVRRGL